MEEERVEPIFLTQDQWFDRGHDITGRVISEDGMWRPTIKIATLVWSPPPAACDIALEELRKARIKQQDPTHIIVCPRLMTPLWMQQLFKCCDLVIEISPNYSYWPTNMLGSCVLGICFPYLSVIPWILRGTPKMLQLRRSLSKVRKTDEVVPKYVPHEPFVAYRRILCRNPFVSAAARGNPFGIHAPLAKKTGIQNEDECKLDSVLFYSATFFAQSD